MQFSERGRELVQAAITWLAEGVSPVPALPRSKEVRLPWRSFEQSPPTQTNIFKWFGQGLNNLAVVCGTGGLLVLDFDNVNDFEAWQVTAGELAGTYTELTGRGAHVFYQVDQPVSKRFNECEALGLGHLCIVAPSVHPGGAIYFPAGDPGAPIKQVKTTDLFFLLSEKESGQACAAGVDPRRDPASSKPAIGSAGNIAKADVVTRLKAAQPLLDYALTLSDLRVSGGGGRWWSGRCPFHEDSKPSFWVDAERQLWGCFAADCKGSKGGDVINLFALASNVTIGDAIKILARKVLL